MESINRLLKEGGVSARERAKVLNDWANELSATGRLAMSDPNLAARLNLVRAPEDFRGLYRELGKQYSGNDLWKKIIERKLERTKEMGCFVAGTLVHTKDGLKPIEKIEVGDLVLSKPENGKGKTSYQPVTRVFSYEDRELYWVGFTPTGSNAIRDQYGTLRTEYIAVTGAHPIWVKSYLQFKLIGNDEVTTPVNNWMSVAEMYRKCWLTLRPYWDEEIDESSLSDPVYTALLADGSHAEIRMPKPILRSPDTKEGVVFDDHPNWSDGCQGMTICFTYAGVVKNGYTALGEASECSYDYAGYDTESEMSVVKRSLGHLPIRRKVYNFEVANNHSYFVGQFGLWVHNTSGLDVSPIPLRPTENLGVYVGDGASGKFI